MGLFEKLFQSKKENDNMANVNLAVIYYSSTGTNYQMAKWAEEGAKATGAEVKVLKVPELAPKEAIEANEAWAKHLEETKDVPEVTLDDLEWADGIVFSVPTRYGNPASQFRQFIDTTGGLWSSGKLVNKVVSAMSSAANPHGGQEATILSIYTSMFHWGAIVAAPGYTDPVQFKAGGNPYGVSTTSGENGIQDDIEDAVRHQAQRTVSIAEGVKVGVNV
jgi:NAD(P)H dehydrogenase (quinone)